MSKTNSARWGGWLGKNAGTPAGQAWLAVMAADYDALTKILSAHGTKATETTQGRIGHPVSALTTAARRGDSLAVRMVIEAGADLDLKASGNMEASPLSWGTEADSYSCVRLLLDAGASPTPPREDLANTAVLYHDYVRNPRADVLELLLSGGVPATSKALYQALCKTAENAVEALLAAGADPNGAERSSGEPPPLGQTVKMAEEQGKRLMKRLLAAGADIHAECGARRQYQRPYLVAAVENGATWAVRTLLEHGADRSAACAFIENHGLRIEEQNRRWPISDAVIELTLNRRRDSRGHSNGSSHEKRGTAE